ncbi:hypothetical protein B0H34DRAFT_789621 [Crassisporium funariophilum]|nr:hypothetical protein B0H34DRAFT_789621 [Crassisporium funariophilum]
MAQFPTRRSTTRTADIKGKDKKDRSHTPPTVGNTGMEDGTWEDEEIIRKRGEDGRSLRHGSLSDSKSIPTTTGPRKQASLAPNARPLRDQVENHSARETLEVLASITVGWLVSVGRYSLTAVGTTIYLLRKPLVLLVWLWLFTLVINNISHALRDAFAPLCIMPGISSLHICRSWDNSSSQGEKTNSSYSQGEQNNDSSSQGEQNNNSYSQGEKNNNSYSQGEQNKGWADYPRLVDVQCTSLGRQLMDAGGSGLSLEIKKAEMATTDLATLVQASNLQGKETLAKSLVKLVDDVKRTGRKLQKLSSMISGAVDNIISVNDYALGAIEAAQKVEPSYPPNQPIDEIVRETFGKAMNVSSDNMELLIFEIEANLLNFDAVEERLLTLHRIVSREISSLPDDIWTKLGGNREFLKKVEQTLKDIGSYRQKALVHVVAALQTLRVMSADMKDLRARVAKPEPVGSRVPIEVHMKSIELGLEKLKEGRIKARKMESLVQPPAEAIGASSKSRSGSFIECVIDSMELAARIYSP